MPFTVTMPKLSPTMEEGTIAKWFAKEGDKLESGDVLIEVTTDKATVEHTVLDGGYLRKIVVQENEIAKVGQVIAIFSEAKDESIEEFEIKKEEKVPEADKTKKEEIEKPEIGDKKETLTNIKQPSFVPFPPLSEYVFKFPTEDINQRIKASPLARKIAKDQSLDLASVKGSGPNNRVMKRDLSLAKPLGKISKNARPTNVPGSYEEKPLTPMRRSIGTRLQQSKSFIPHFYVSQEVNVDNLVSLRNQLKNNNVKITFNDFIIRACSLALSDHPVVNACFNTEKDAIAYFKTIDIAVAVTIEGGLITPIVRHANYKNVQEISVEVKDLVQKAKEMKLRPEEYQGGSFTISNLGMFNITDFVAVINPPQAAILAVGGIQEKPIVKNDKIIIGKTMALTLSADHRVVDGVDGAKFMKDLQKYLENPASLLL